MDNYYEFSVRSMDTAVRMAETNRPDSDSWKESDGTTWQVSGLFMGPALDEEDKRALIQSAKSEEELLRAFVSDNGTCGEGLWLEFAPTARGGSPASKPDSWGSEFGEEMPRPLFGVELTPDQAEVIGQSLIAAAQLARVSQRQSRERSERDE